MFRYVLGGGDLPSDYRNWVDGESGSGCFTFKLIESWATVWHVRNDWLGASCARLPRSLELDAYEHDTVAGYERAVLFPKTAEILVQP